MSELGGPDTLGNRFHPVEAPDDKRTTDQDRDPNADYEIADRYFRAGELLTSEKVVAAETPRELFEGVRELLRDSVEDAETPRSLSSHYNASRLLESMKDRASMIEISATQLAREGKIKNYNPATGEGEPVRKKFDAYAISGDEYVRKDPQVRHVEIGIKYNFGTDESRKELSRAYNQNLVSKAGVCRYSKDCKL